MTEHEVELTGGNINSGVMRAGNTVRRATSPASPAVHPLLQHLEYKGFAGSPRFLGIDEQGREILSYLDGETGILDSNWQDDEALVAAARLLRHYHDATIDFVGRDDLPWAYRYPEASRHEVICHNDFAPYNFVYRDGIPCAMIDFDLAGPGPRLRDVAYAAYWMVPLSFNSADQRAFAEADASTGSRRLHLFCATYGIAAGPPLLDMIAEVLTHMGSKDAARRMVGDVKAEQLQRDGHLAHWQREAAAFQTHRARLEANMLTAGV